MILSLTKGFRVQIGPTRFSKKETGDGGKHAPITGDKHGHRSPTSNVKENDMEPVSVTVNDACRMIGCCRNLIYNLINEDKLESYHIGKRRLIKTDSIKKFVAESKPNDQAA